MRFRFLSVAVLVVASVFTAAHASPITYTLTGTFTGSFTTSLGTNAFSSTPGSIQLVANGPVTTLLAGVFYTNTSGVSSITLQGIGTAFFLNSTFGASSAPGGAGFYDTSTGFGSSLYDPALSDPLLPTYSLSAPFSDTGTLLTSLPAAYGATELTSLGDLSLSGDDGSIATFTATTSAMTGTPEPGSFALLGTGLISIAGVVRKRFA